MKLAIAGALPRLLPGEGEPGAGLRLAARGGLEGASDRLAARAEFQRRPMAARGDNLRGGGWRGQYRK